MEMKNNISLFSVTPETGGIFSALDSYDVPWKTAVNSDLLDLEYYGNISGQKAISPLVRKSLFYGVLTENKQQVLANLIFSMYGPYWAKEWATLSKQYDPIANYDMTEIMEDDETVIEYGKTEDTTTGNTHTKTGTETDTPAVSVTTDDSVYGFNSSDDVPSNKRQQTPSGTDETEYDLSETDSGSVGLEQGGSDTHTRNYTLTRKGNIGVTTSQQLLQAERDLWMWNFFLKVVFPNVDSVLTIPVYVDEDEEAETPDRPEGTIQIVQNGTVNVLDYAYADVNVPNSYSVEDQGKVVYGDLLLQQTSREVVNNGIYDTTLNNQVSVDVPNSYTQEDEGKVVDNGALVAQTSRTITENGEYDTTLNNTVNVDILTQIYNADYDFTESLIDSVNEFTASLSGNAYRDSSGVHIENAAGYLTLQNNYFYGMVMDIFVGDMDIQSRTNHNRFIMITDETGLIYRSTGVWSFYYSTWSTDSNITDPNYFENSKVTIRIDGSGKWHIYKDDVLVYEPNVSMSAASFNNKIKIGSSGQSFYNCVIEKIQIH